MALQFVSSVPHEEMHNELWLKRMEESGIDGFEYSCGPFPPTAELQSKLDIVTPYIKSGRLKFPSVHMPAWFTSEAPGQKNDFERDMCIRRFINFIETALPLGVKNLTMHPGALPEGHTREEGIDALRKTLKGIAPTAEKYGFSLNLELCPRRSIGKTVEDMEIIMQDMPDSVGICFDVNHANERWAEIPEWIARLGKYIRTFHISDCDEYDECHWMPGVGVLDWEAIMREIRKLDRDLLLIYEINRVAYGAGKREVDPRFFFKAIKQNMLWLDTVGK